MCFVEDQHVEARGIALLEKPRRRMVGRDEHRLGAACRPLDRGSGAAISLDPELCVQFLDPLRDENLRAHDEHLSNAAPLHQLADDEPGSDRLPEPDVVSEQRHGQAAAESHQVLHLMMKRLDAVFPVNP